MSLLRKTITDSPTARHFLKCRRCKKPWAVEVARALPFRSMGGVWEFCNLHPCPHCGKQPVRDQWPHLHMGEVVGQRLAYAVSESPCDGRCTEARGPSCDCPCGGVNHGTGRVVYRMVDAGPAPKAALA